MGEIDEILKDIKKSNHNTKLQNILREPQSDHYSKVNKNYIDLDDGFPVNEGTNLDKGNNSKGTK